MLGGAYMTGKRRMAKKNLKKIFLSCILIVILMTILKIYCGYTSTYSAFGRVSKNSYKYTHSNNETSLITYDYLTPLIFVGGMPRSGTTLMRALLDAHSDIRCGEETRIIPRILSLKGQWTRSKKEVDRLLEGGITNDVITSATAAFIIEIIVKHGEPAPHLCNKDPFTLKYMVDLYRMFPNARFLLMIRDGRAVVHSVISRKVTITGFDLNNFEASLEKWNSITSSMYSQCKEVGPERCMMVYYEQLVLHPLKVMTDVLNFLKIPWDERVMHHQDFINKPGGISLSKSERSTDQVVKPVNLEALTKWVVHVPENVKKNMRKLAPMLEKLGYDPDGYPPKYGVPDAKVWNQTNQVLQNSEYWSLKAAQVHSKINDTNPSAKNPFASS